MSGDAWTAAGIDEAERERFAALGVSDLRDVFDWREVAVDSLETEAYISAGVRHPADAKRIKKAGGNGWSAAIFATFGVYDIGEICGLFQQGITCRALRELAAAGVTSLHDVKVWFGHQLAAVDVAGYTHVGVTDPDVGHRWAADGVAGRDAQKFLDEAGEDLGTPLVDRLLELGQHLEVSPVSVIKALRRSSRVAVKAAAASDQALTGALRLHVDAVLRGEKPGARYFEDSLSMFDN